MERRNRLKIKSNDNTMSFSKQDSSIIIPPRNENEELKSDKETIIENKNLEEINSIFDSLDFEPQIRENYLFENQKEKSKDSFNDNKRESLKNTLFKENNTNNLNEKSFNNSMKGMKNDFLENQKEILYSTLKSDLLDNKSFAIKNTKEIKKYENIKEKIMKFICFIKNYWLYTIFISIIIYLIYKPSEYNFLLEEIQKLREIKKVDLPKELENIADIFKNASVISHSLLYKYGFMKRTTTDPNSLLEPGNGFLCLDNRDKRLFFELKFTNIFKIKKFAIYHPSNGNPKSAIKNFAIIYNNNELKFQFNGKYQEYDVDIECDNLVFVILDNYGESNYTSIYRVSVFA